jgi:hypothetical protein
MKNLALSIALLLAVLSPRAGETIRVAKIELEDQHEKLHAISFPATAPVFLAVADRAASESMKVWTSRCKQEFGTNVVYIGVADVRKVPGLLRGFIRGKFQKAYPHPVLMDWSGKVAERLRAQEAVPNVFILSKTGEVLAAERGDFTAEKMSRLKAALSPRSLTATRQNY